MQLALLLLANAPTVRTVDGVKHKISIESVIIWVWNALMTITFDEQVVSEDDGQPEVEVILDRPLRGEPYMDEQMYCRQGLCSIACMDITGGGCVVAQIAETVMRRVRKDIPGQWPRVRVVNEVPRFKPQASTVEIWQ